MIVISWENIGKSWKYTLLANNMMQSDIKILSYNIFYDNTILSDNVK
jgi:hypothetical protein